MESPIEVVRRFCVAWSEGMGADALGAFFTHDADHNIPLAPPAGRSSASHADNRDGHKGRRDDRSP